MNGDKLSEVPKTPSESSESSESSEMSSLDEQVILSIVTKIADLDDQVTKLTGTRIGLMVEIEDMQQRLGDLEIKCAIVSKKLDQGSFPSLLDEFIKAKRMARKTQAKKPVPKKKK
jgi:hypothetical protein